MHEDPAIAGGERWRMDHLRQLAELRGYFLRREAIEIGVDDRALTLGVRRGVYVRIRQGAYCHTDLWQAKSPVDCHLARSYAAQDLTPGPTALSHVSALAHYGCPLWDAPLDLVHLTRLDQGSSRREAGVVHHDGQVPEKDVVLREGRLGHVADQVHPRRAHDPLVGVELRCRRLDAGAGPGQPMTSCGSARRRWRGGPARCRSTSGSGSLTGGASRSLSPGAAACSSGWGYRHRRAAVLRLRQGRTPDRDHRLRRP